MARRESVDTNISGPCRLPYGPWLSRFPLFNGDREQKCFLSRSRLEPIPVRSINRAIRTGLPRGSRLRSICSYIPLMLRLPCLEFCQGNHGLHSAAEDIKQDHRAILTPVGEENRLAHFALGGQKHVDSVSGLEEPAAHAAHGDNPAFVFPGLES